MLNLIFTIIILFLPQLFHFLLSVLNQKLKSSLCTLLLWTHTMIWLAGADFNTWSRIMRSFYLELSHSGLYKSWEEFAHLIETEQGTKINRGENRRAVICQGSSSQDSGSSISGRTLDQLKHFSDYYLDIQLKQPWSNKCMDQYFCATWGKDAHRWRRATLETRLICNLKGESWSKMTQRVLTQVQEAEVMPSRAIKSLN